METKKRAPKRNRHTGGKVAGSAVLLALLLAGGHFGLGIGREGGGLLTGDRVQNTAEMVTQSLESAAETVTETAQQVQETVVEVVSPRDDGVLTITVQEDKLLYEVQAVTMAELEEKLLADYEADATRVELRDDHAIKAAYDEVSALLQKLAIPFTEGK